MTDAERIAELEARTQALDAALAAALEEHKTWAVCLDRLRKECATCCLQLLASAFIGTIDEGLADLVKGKTDKDVLSLVIGHNMHPLGVCWRCGRPAPVVEVPSTQLDSEGEPYTDEVCSWGCPR